MAAKAKPRARKPKSKASSTALARRSRSSTAVRSKPPAWYKPFLAELAEGRTVREACLKAKTSRGNAYQARQRDEKFAVAWHDAEEHGTDLIEQEMFRRAVEGNDRPVFQGGAQVGAVREYSDDLIKFIMRARRPGKYRDNVRIEHTGADGGPIETRAILGGKDPASLQPQTRRAIADALAKEAARSEPIDVEAN